MCGIVGFTGKDDAKKIVLKGLKKLSIEVTIQLE